MLHGLRVVFFIHLHSDDIEKISERGVFAPLFLFKYKENIFGVTYLCSMYLVVLSILMKVYTT